MPAPIETRTGNTLIGLKKPMSLLKQLRNEQQRILAPVAPKMAATALMECVFQATGSHTLHELLVKRH